MVPAVSIYHEKGIPIIITVFKYITCWALYVDDILPE